MSVEDRAFTSKGATTRDRIVDAARTMLLERGYDGLVLRELADEVDIQLGNLQYYFKTREALALHVLGLEGGRDVRFIGEQRREGTAADAFRAAVRNMVASYREESGRLLSMITALAQHHESFRQLYRDSYAEFYPVFEDLLREMRPGLDDEEVVMRARIINALVEGSSFQTQIGDVDTFSDRILAEAEAIALR